MRAKEFIAEYATAKKPDFTRVSKPCPECKGNGNINIDGSTQTCPSCKGVGSDDPTLSQQAQGLGPLNAMNPQNTLSNTLWAAGSYSR